ncbi:glycoside hydrolase family 3 C-terminal domain-containing protein [Acidipropionibacterium acidipropionici]|uniref:glycoside hydrolase family 3 C-terminal domain-containing protein n=1 Tax=Acidipropionibacterium acidipropionici TaxID=1748 RepID=UPI000408EF83|nr:glycoside hydrolase family 3 C-terminal domain-containing protein [Acidipropionibacterium acidipropionici]ALN15846.1 glycosyl hydrolase family 3 [Acidipropionibacterium acidipropionici]APZ08408.1 glycosyl hydrolase [Acidipropionibacterium acidipropionici]
MTELTDLPQYLLIRLLSGADDWRTVAAGEVGVRSLHLSDGPHGLRVPDVKGGSLPATCFPTAVTLGASWDRELAEEVGGALAVEAGALGVDVVLGPGMNIKRHPLGGRNFEYLSEDPVVSGELAAAMVRGIQGRGVAACVKHFAVNNQETMRLCVDAVVDERTLHEIYLAAFETVVRTARPAAVMASYNEINGTAATTNRRLITEVLRGRWGFDGLVMSDWGAVWDRVAALEAGLDLEMPSSAGAFDRSVAAALDSGRLGLDAVLTSVSRLVGLQNRISPPRIDRIPADEHDALARRAAAAGTVLAANDGILPLAAGSKVAVIGAFAARPRYQGSGSSQVNPTRVTGLLEALGAKDVEVGYARGYDPDEQRTDAVLVAEAAELAAASDVAVVVTGPPEELESEGYDRTGMDLPAQHDALVRAVLAANPRTVIVVCSGSPVALPWADRAAAVVLAGLGGQAGGGALADVLVGDAEPGGRLAETWPHDLSEVASDPWFPGTGAMVQYREGPAIGYRHTATNGVEPAFCFGHGLSYTRFDWRDAVLTEPWIVAGDGLSVDVEVANVGDRAGSDVVQVYLSDRTGVVSRPRRWLAGFAKVRLEAGQSRRVQVAVGARELGFWDVEKHDWVVPSGHFDVELGRSAHDIVATLDLVVSEGADHAPERAWTPLIAEDDEAFAARLGHEIPRPAATTPFTARSTLGQVRHTPLGGLLHAAAMRRLAAGVRDPRFRRMMEHTVDELPLRNLPSMTKGLVPLESVSLIVDVLNGAPDEILRRSFGGALGLGRGVVDAGRGLWGELSSRIGRLGR